jgi:hypothetical protein
MEVERRIVPTVCDFYLDCIVNFVDFVLLVSERFEEGAILFGEYLAKPVPE